MNDNETRDGNGVADLFRLDPQTAPTTTLPASGSADCTSDGCTGSCVGC